MRSTNKVRLAFEYLATDNHEAGTTFRSNTGIAARINPMLRRRMADFSSEKNFEEWFDRQVAITLSAFCWCLENQSLAGGPSPQPPFPQPFMFLLYLLMWYCRQ